MSAPRTAADVLDQNFLEIRCRLLDLAASLDRIDRTGSAGSLDRDERMVQIRGALALLATPGPDRAERIQLLFSDPYDPRWDG
jgi:spore maturation protein CgeB